MTLIKFFNGLHLKKEKKESIKISTIKQPVENIAKQAVKALINIIDNKEISLPVKFIKGYTTK
jgi:LacI family transcriptional regulator